MYYLLSVRATYYDQDIICGHGKAPDFERSRIDVFSGRRQTYLVQYEWGGGFLSMLTSWRISELSILFEFKQNSIWVTEDGWLGTALQTDDVCCNGEYFTPATYSIKVTFLI